MKQDHKQGERGQRFHVVFTHQLRSVGCLDYLEHWSAAVNWIHEQTWKQLQLLTNIGTPGLHLPYGEYGIKGFFSKPR